MSYSYLWEFRVPAEHREEFEQGYGPRGEWVELFRRDPSYRGTRFLRDRHDPGRFLTIDSWVSFEAYQAFHRRHATELAAIDARYESRTSCEVHLGDFEEVESAVVTGGETP